MVTERGSNSVELKLPKPPGVFRRWLAAHPRTVDGIIVGTYLFGCALMVVLELASGYSAQLYGDLDPEHQGEQVAAFGAHLQWPWVLTNIAITAIIALALAYRRRSPVLGTFVISCLMFFEQGLLIAPNSVALVFLLYAVPVYRTVRAGWITFGVVVLINTVLSFLIGDSLLGFIGPSGIARAGSVDLRTAVSLSVANALWLLAVLLVSINMGNRRRYIEALIDKAHQLAVEREQRAQLAASAERSRIAREMHDIVAHSLSVVVTLSEGASVAVATKPEAAQKAMVRAAETGRTALVEMRRLLGVLSDPAQAESESLSDADLATRASAARAPQPSLIDLPQLIDGFRQVGLRIDFAESGEPSTDATQELAIYRIVQEALTNVLRHAGKHASVSVSLEHTDEGARIEVLDSGAEPHDESTSVQSDIPGAGRGLTGASERARMFGGSLEAGPYGSGWRVRAFVPTDPATTTTEGGAQ